MSKIAVVILAILLLAMNIQMAAALTSNDDPLKDSKPETLSVKDQVFFRQDNIWIGAATAKVLINRITNRVAYVFHNGYRRYIRPKFIMPNAQALYDQTRRK